VRDEHYCLQTNQRHAGHRSSHHAALKLCFVYPDATVHYHSSDMCLHIHSDASYLSDTSSRIRTGGIFFLSAKPADPVKPPSVDAPPYPYNGAIHTSSAIMAKITALATEAECGALFHNARESIPLRATLK
jgi:hypothetical protein